MGGDSSKPETFGGDHPIPWGSGMLSVRLVERELTGDDLVLEAALEDKERNAWSTTISRKAVCILRDNVEMVSGEPVPAVAPPAPRHLPRLLMRCFR